MNKFSPSDQLRGRVLNRITQYEQKKLRLKIAGFSILVIGSLGTVAFGTIATLGDAAQSGFFQFASLLFYNFPSAVASFSDVALSLVESFPVFSAALLLGGVFAVIWSVARLLNEFTFMRSHHLSIT